MEHPIVDMKLKDGSLTEFDVQVISQNHETIPREDQAWAGEDVSEGVRPLSKLRLPACCRTGRSATCTNNVCRFLRCARDGHKVASTEKTCLATMALMRSRVKLLLISASSEEHT